MTATQSGAGQTVAWTSRMTYTLAAIGAAVGLGNVWKFPYMAGNGGGGAFVIVYLAALVIAAGPLFMAESVIGRLGRASPPAAFRALGRTAGNRLPWAFSGYLGLVGTVLVLSFYSVIAGWTLAFAVKSATGAFAGADGPAMGAAFAAFTASPATLMAWQGLFIAACVGVVGRGLLKGTERANNIMMPALFVLLALLLVYAMIEGDFTAGVRYLLAPDWSKIDAAVILSAVGQALFTLGVGIGGIMAYGAYVGEGVSIARVTAVVVAADTAVALVAGLVVFPIVFAHGLAPDEGPGLVFVTLPIAFGNMPLGAFVGTAFFVLLFFGAITSAISIMEPGVMWLAERGWKRFSATAVLAGAAWVIGLGTVFSFNIWRDLHPLAAIGRFADANVFGLIDYGVNNLLLPVNGIAFCLFVGWVLGADPVRHALGMADGWGFGLWRWSVRIAAPAALTAVLIGNL